MAKAEPVEEVKVWTKEEIRSNIAKSDVWLIRGLVALYNKQTEDEKGSETTKYDNGQGFNSRDAGFMTSLAKFYLRESRLTPKQTTACRKTIKKYCSQLAKIANQEI